MRQGCRAMPWKESDQNRELCASQQSTLQRALNSLLSSEAFKIRVFPSYRTIRMNTHTRKHRKQMFMYNTRVIILFSLSLFFFLENVNAKVKQSKRAKCANLQKNDPLFLFFLFKAKPQFENHSYKMLCMSPCHDYGYYAIHINTTDTE